MKLRILSNASYAIQAVAHVIYPAMFVRRAGPLAASTLLLQAGLSLPVLADQERVFHASPGTTLPETSGHVVRDINEHGTITVSATLAAKSRGFVLGDRGLEVVPGLKKYDFSTAFGINNHGDVVGSANGLVGLQALVVKANGTIVELQLPAGDVSSGAYAVNDDGIVVGYSSGATGIRAVRWSDDGQVTALVPVANAKSTRALGVNARGVTVGVAAMAAGSQAVRWTEGEVTLLQSLPGNLMSEALAINDRGVIVGSSGNPQITRRAVLWTRDLVIEDLGALPGGRSSRALGINEQNEIVGTAETPDGNHAFYWTRAGGMQDLNDMVSLPAGLVLTQAASINSQGSIVAIGYFDNHTGSANADPNAKAGVDNHELPLQIVRINPVN